MKTGGLRPAREKEKGPPASRRSRGARRRRPAARCSPTLLGVVPSPRGPLTSVFGKGTGVTAPPRPPAKNRQPETKESKTKAAEGAQGRARTARRAIMFFVLAPGRAASRHGGGRSGQAARPIRTGLLRPSRALRTRPVHPVVFRGPSACSRTGRNDLRGGLALRCLQRLSRCGVATRRCPLAGQPEHQRPPAPGPLVLGGDPVNSPAPAEDKDRTVSRRSEPSSRTTLIGEQPNPWDLLQPQDVMSRHRGAKPRRRCGRLGAISLLSPEYLLSDEQRRCHVPPLDH